MFKCVCFSKYSLLFVPDLGHVYIDDLYTKLALSLKLKCEP